MVELKELSIEHSDTLNRLFQINRDVLEAYLVEEVFGWSVSRLVCLDDQIVGLIQVRKLDLGKGYGVLGTWLVPQVWGTGINGKAKDAMLRLIFRERPDVERMYLCIEEENVRSLKAAANLPYTEALNEKSVPLELREGQPGSGCRWFVIRKDKFDEVTR